MKVKQTVFTFGAFLSLFSGGLLLTSPVMAAKCGGADTAIISCEAAEGKTDNIEQNAIWKLLVMVLNIMIAGVGILAVAGVVYAAVLYTTAADRADQVKKAKDIILNVAIGVIAFGLMYSLLNFLIPGGIFN